MAARFLLQSSTYCKIALEHLFAGEAAYQEAQTISADPCDSYDYNALLRREKLGNASEQFLVTVCFSAMALESFIYDYAARFLGDGYTSKYLDKLDAVSKWLVVPRLITGKELDRGGQSMELLRDLVRQRNQMIHAKSRPFIPEAAMAYLDAQGEEDDRQMAIRALQAVYLLAQDLDELDPEATCRFLLGIGSSYEPKQFTVDEIWVKFLKLAGMPVKG